MHNYRLLLLLLPVLLQGCQTAPRVLVQAICPSIPEMQELPSDVLEKDYIARMQLFLSGKLPTQEDYALPSKPVTPSTAKQEKP